MTLSTSVEQLLLQVHAAAAAAAVADDDCSLRAPRALNQQHITNLQVNNKT